MLFTGTAGNDIITGTGDDDIFDMFQGGRDRIVAQGGNDTFNFGATLTADDRIDGGDGEDILNIAGDYSAGLVFNANSLASVERINLASGNSYNLTLVDENTSGTCFIFGSGTDLTHRLIFDGSADTDTDFDVFDTGGNDVLTGGAGNDGFVLRLGNDTAIGGAGVDNFVMDSFFGAGDSLDGGADNDFVALFGDYSAGLTISKTMMQNMEVFQLTGDFDYNLTLENKVVGSGASLAIDASFIGAGHFATIDGSAERFGTFAFVDSAGDDTFLGGHGADFFNLSHGGDEIANGGDGDDTFNLVALLTRNDKIDGGDGHDILFLGGDYSSGVVFKAATLKGIEEINMDSGNSYGLTMNDGNVAAGEELGVSGSSFGVNDVLSFDGSQELDGTFHVEGGLADDFMLGGNANGAGDTFVAGGGEDNVNGGRGNDQLFGGDGDDLLSGDKGADLLDGGTGSNTIAIVNVAGSTGVKHDTVAHFNAANDSFDLSVAVTAIDAFIAVGDLSQASFDADLAAAVDAAHLHRHRAVQFAPDGGDLNGHTFLVIDANGHAGYQAGEDIVVELVDGINLNITISNFT